MVGTSRDFISLTFCMVYFDAAVEKEEKCVEIIMQSDGVSPNEPDMEEKSDRKGKVVSWWYYTL